MLIALAVGVFLFSSEGFRSISVPNVSAVSVVGSPVGVYWDQAATNSCVSILWGTLMPGQNETVVLYVRNEANESLYYLLTTSHWNSVNASRYIDLRWDYNGSSMSPGSVLQVSLTLSVWSWISGVTDFSFDVVIVASHYLVGDVNFDGNVDTMDIAIIGKAFGSSPGSDKWNPAADVNGDGSVDTMDLAIAIKNFGKSV